MVTNVAYGVPKYTATRNNKLLVVSFLAKSLLFRVAVHFGSPYPTLLEDIATTRASVPSFGLVISRALKVT